MPGYMDRKDKNREMIATHNVHFPKGISANTGK